MYNNNIKRFLPSDFLRNRRYLPSAFDSEPTILGQVNLIIEYLKQTDEQINELYEKWKELCEWIENNGFKDYVEEILKEWLEDGTLEPIIKKIIDGRIDELETTVRGLINKVNEMIDKEFSFDMDNREPTFLFEFSGIRNAVNQYIAYDEESNCFYSTQSDSKNPEGFYINKLSPTGKFISYMHIPEGGHGTTIGIDRNTNGDLKIWLFHTGLKRLIQVQYKDFQVLSVNEASTYTNYTPIHLSNKYFTPITDPYFDRVILRIDDGRVENWDRMNIRNKTGEPVWVGQIPTQYNNEQNALQGIAVYGDEWWVQSGYKDMQITYYNKDKFIKVIEYPRFLFSSGNRNPRDGEAEPEGIFFYKDRITGKKTMFIAFTTGAVGKRYNLLYYVSQLGNGGTEKWTSHRALTTQGYQRIRSTGAYLRIPDGYDDLNKLLEPGEYYLSGDEAGNLKNFPYPTDGHAFIYIVSPYNNVHNRQQTLIRLSSARKNLEITRSIGYDYVNNTVNPGKWTFSFSGNYGEYLPASGINNLMANMQIEGEFYMTSVQAQAMTDKPTGLNNVGCTLRNSCFSVENAGNISFRQELITNWTVAYKRWVRNVTVSFSNGSIVNVSNWALIESVTF